MCFYFFLSLLDLLHFVCHLCNFFCVVYDLLCHLLYVVFSFLQLCPAVLLVCPANFHLTCPTLNFLQATHPIVIIFPIVLPKTPVLCFFLLQILGNSTSFGPSTHISRVAWVAPLPACFWWSNSVLSHIVMCVVFSTLLACMCPCKPGVYYMQCLLGSMI